MSRALILVLGDQLIHDRGALQGADPSEDQIVMAEVAEEARYVRHNRHKIAFIFSAMRHIRDELRALGFTSLYWHFIVRHSETLGANARMKLAPNNWQRNPGVAT